MGPFSQNVSFLKLQLFFLLSRPTYQVNSIFFSGSSNLQGSCYWWSIFSSLATVTMKSQKVSFLCFLVKYWNKFLQHHYAACQSKLCLEKQSQTNENYSVKIIEMIYLLPFCQRPRPWSKNVTKFSFIFASIYHIPEWIWFV